LYDLFPSLSLVLALLGGGGAKSSASRLKSSLLSSLSPIDANPNTLVLEEANAYVNDMNDLLSLNVKHLNFGF
jgi:hypothetical protein